MTIVWQPFYDALADKGYDSQPLRDTLREMGIRPLVEHRVFAPYDHAHNACIKDVQSALNDRDGEFFG